MIIYAYKVDHDVGQNPNPFGEYCTLAYCKGTMRNSIQNHVSKQQLKNPNLSIRDMQIWVFGIAGIKFGNEYTGRLIYSMHVTEILAFEEYWVDSRFKYKISALDEKDWLIIERGDDQRRNFAFWRGNKDYRRCGDNISGTKNKDSEYVLISDTFIYHGDDTRKQKEFVSPSQVNLL